MAIALVTGGSRGIGRATALLLAQEGYTVAVNYQQNLHAAQEVMNKITAYSLLLLIVSPISLLIFQPNS